LYALEGQGRHRTSPERRHDVQPARAAIRYLVDGKSATCTSAMALSRDSIASVEVLKGPGAALYGASAAEIYLLDEDGGPAS
jgi:hypothetical protein